MEMARGGDAGPDDQFRLGLQVLGDVVRSKVGEVAALQRRNADLEAKLAEGQEATQRLVEELRELRGRVHELEAGRRHDAPPPSSPPPPLSPSSAVWGCGPRSVAAPSLAASAAAPSLGASAAERELALGRELAAESSAALRWGYVAGGGAGLGLGGACAATGLEEASRRRAPTTGAPSPASTRWRAPAPSPEERVRQFFRSAREDLDPDVFAELLEAVRQLSQRPPLWRELPGESQRAREEVLLSVRDLLTRAGRGALCRDFEALLEEVLPPPPRQALPRAAPRPRAPSAATTAFGGASPSNMAGPMSPGPMSPGPMSPGPMSPMSPGPMSSVSMSPRPMSPGSTVSARCLRAA